MKQLLFLFFSCILYAQSTTGVYLVYQEAVLSTAAQTVTIQQVANGTRDIQFVSVALWCTVDATFSFSRTGTAATTTTLTPTRINPWQPASTVAAFSASNVGAGTLIRKYDFKAGSSDYTIDLSNVLIPRNAGTTGNITFATNSVTGTCRISVVYKELR